MGKTKKKQKENEEKVEQTKKVEIKEIEEKIEKIEIKEETKIENEKQEVETNLNEKNFKFPKFPESITLKETLEAIKGYDDFSISETKDGFIFVKYHTNDNKTFPELSTAKDEKELRRFQILRECRGICFEKKTGKCIARRFHKFFNIDEREETRIENIDFDRPYYLVEKLDGSLVSPLIVNDQIFFTTMSGFTEFTSYIDKYMIYAEKKKIYYEKFCRKILEMNKTPLFEWCNSDSPVVIKHERTHLTLLNIRDIKTGVYESYKNIEKLAKEYNIPVVEFVEKKTRGKKLIQEIYEEREIEGYVICFEDGDFYKVKTNFYMCAHGISPNARYWNQRLILRAICQDVIDDIIATLPFSKEQKFIVQKWRDDAHERLKGKAKKLDTFSKTSIELEKQVYKYYLEHKNMDPLQIIKNCVVEATYVKTEKGKKLEVFEWLGLKDIPKAQSK